VFPLDLKQPSSCPEEENRICQLSTSDHICRQLLAEKRTACACE